jgi:hypothetical protein
MGAFADLGWSFVVQTLSGVAAVFVGIWLALVVERRRRAEDAAEHAATLMQEFDRAMDTILGSVVKNTAEAKRILRLLAQPGGPRLIHAELETSAWYASHNQFITLCRNVDQRVIFAQFFDDVRRLQAFIDFRCNVQVSTTTARLHDEPEVHALEVATDKQLAALAEDLRFCGVLLITDHGKPVHKRLMGIRIEPKATPAG